MMSQHSQLPTASTNMTLDFSCVEWTVFSNVPVIYIFHRNISAATNDVEILDRASYAVNLIGSYRSLARCIRNVIVGL